MAIELFGNPLPSGIWGRGAAGSEIPLRVLQDSDVRELKVPSIDRLDYFRQKPTL